MDGAGYDFFWAAGVKLDQPDGVGAWQRGVAVWGPS